MRRFGSLLVGAGLAVVAVACSGTGSDAAPATAASTVPRRTSTVKTSTVRRPAVSTTVTTARPATTTRPVTTARPATTVTAAPAPGKPSVATPVTDTGWGVVRVGMTYPELKAALPVGTARPQGYDDFDGYCWYVQPLGRKGPAIMMLAAANSTAINTATVGRIESWIDDAKPLTTNLGIGPGATKAQVLAAYPNAVSSPHHYTDGGIYLDVKLGANRMLRFELPEGDLVEAMFLGTTEAAGYVEGCA